jgi:hypothetical protein
MCDSVTHCEGPKHNWHIFLSHWARSLRQDWDPGCHDPLIWGIHEYVITWTVFITIVTVCYKVGPHFGRFFHRPIWSPWSLLSPFPGNRVSVGWVEKMDFKATNKNRFATLEEWTLAPRGCLSAEILPRKTFKQNFQKFLKYLNNLILFLWCTERQFIFFYEKWKIFQWKNIPGHDLNYVHS